MTTRDPTARAAPDLVQRDFRVDGPDQLWVADITYAPTGAGSSMSLSCWMRGPGGWSAGRWPRTCGPSWCWLPWAWRWSSDTPSASFIAPITVASTPPWPTGSGVSRSASDPRWGRGRIRQCTVWELVCDARVWAARPRAVPDPSRGAPSGIRLHQVVRWP